MSQILDPIEHVVVVMLENRSLDQMLGGLYSGATPSLVLPAASPAGFDGLAPGLCNPSNSSFFDGAAPQNVDVVTAVQSSTVPDPDPEETFVNVSYQIFGPETPSSSPRWPMKGFLVNYATTGASDTAQIMQCHSADQVPVIATLARQYAVCDAWFAPVPSQTWPNRAFAHTGQSNGHVDNGDVPDPFEWNVATIFGVLEAMKFDWSVYHDTVLVPALTRTQFPSLWDSSLDGRFRVIDDFEADCAQNKLPRYAFVEPSFLLDPTDEHPPHDVNAGEAFLYRVWSAVSRSPAFASTLLVITYDEHGGCFDHVSPPFGARPPDAAHTPGDQGFGFDRFGVRVPAVVISPWIKAGTVFRSNTATPYDHTSILATLRDWLPIPAGKMLTSARIAAAPTLAQVLTQPAPRIDTPVIPAPTAAVVPTPVTAPPNALQRSLVSGTARRDGADPATALARIQSRQHAIDYFRARRRASP